MLNPQKLEEIAKQISDAMPAGVKNLGEEIDRDEVLEVIVEKRPPSLRRGMTLANHVLCDRRLGDLDTQHLQLAVNARGTPANVLAGHAADESAHFGKDGAPTAPPTAMRFPGPIQTKALTMPT